MNEFGGLDICQLQSLLKDKNEDDSESDSELDKVCVYHKNFF